MSSSQASVLLGRIALTYKLVTPEQLREATRVQGRFGNDKKLGEIMLELGYIDEKQLVWLLKAQEQVLAKQRQSQATPSATSSAPAPAPAPAPAAPSAPVAVAPTPTPTPAPAPPQAARTPVAPSPVDPILAHAVKAGASDVHFHCGLPVQLRIHGVLRAFGQAPVSRADAERMLEGILPPADLDRFRVEHDLDFAYTLAGVGRFRVNVYQQQRGLDAVFRVIPPEPPSLQDLGLPTTLARLTTYHQGLVLITGPAGCGKSSTLAALVGLINEERRDHIITVEDPIEYLHPSKGCIVNQRQVVRHTGSFASALRAALREDPDVIAIGELRDLETVSLAITAAETGHLVLATLHTNSAIRTINRVLDVFPPAQQSQIRSMVSESLRAVVSQRLVPTADGKRRVAALEVLMVNTAVANLIREDKTFQIASILQTGRAQGMSRLDDSLAELVKTGVVTKEIARRFCDDQRMFV